MSDILQRNPPRVILCDMCTEERRPARKTCMKCEISMCVQHLQAHLTTPVLLQTHPLTEPMAFGHGGLVGTTKCPKHGKLLEYYCLDDRTCVCVSCAIEDQHSKHNMKTFSTAHKLLLEKVKAEKQALQVKTGEESVSLEKWEKSEREKLGRSSVRLIEAMNNLRDVTLTSVQSSVSSLMMSIKTSRSSLQAAGKERDTFRFLQMYSQVYQDVEKAKAVDLSKGLEPGSDRDKLVQEIIQKGENIKEQASQFWASLLTYVDPENHQELSATGSETFFDPQTYGPGISLSKDNRKVFLSDWQGKKTPFTFLIQGTESSADPRIHRWIIRLSEDCDWTVGVCAPNYEKESCDKDVYGLCWEENKLSYLKTHYNVFRSVLWSVEYPMDSGRRVSSHLLRASGDNEAKEMIRPKEVEVVWNNLRSISFFSVIGQHQKREIVTLAMNLARGHLTPFVCFNIGEPQNHSITTRTSRTGASSASYWQKQWKCSCGQVFPWMIPQSSSGHYSYQTYTGHKCVCGKPPSAPHSTEVLCELL